MGNFQHVLSPFTFGSVTVKNRIELSPACHMLATPDGFVTREMVAYYQSLAKGGAGIITIGASPIDYGYAKDHSPMATTSIMQSGLEKSGRYPSRQ